VAGRTISYPCLCRLVNNTALTSIPESDAKRIFNGTLAAVKGPIQLLENPRPTMVIFMEAAHIDNAIFLYHLFSNVVLEEHEFGSGDQNSPISDNFAQDTIDF
jgi:hypothetical protein